MSRPAIFCRTALPEHVVRKKGQKAFRLQQYLTKEARRLARTRNGNASRCWNRTRRIKGARHGRLKVLREQPPEYAGFPAVCGGCPYFPERGSRLRFSAVKNGQQFFQPPDFVPAFPENMAPGEEQFPLLAADMALEERGQPLGNRIQFLPERGKPLCFRPPEKEYRIQWNCPMVPGGVRKPPWFFRAYHVQQFP